MATNYFLGIDAGTQGLSVILTDDRLNVIATGTGDYEMLTGQPAGCYEQRPDDWMRALRSAMTDLREQLAGADLPLDVLCIGISGQMHGEVLAGAGGDVLSTARLWCDARNELEGGELTRLFGVKAPKRMTAARWLWTIRNRPDVAAKTRHITTPAGWIAYQLTGQWQLGIGDASGMFPIDQATLDYDKRLLGMFDAFVSSHDVQPLQRLLPTICTAGQDGGALSAAAAELLGLREGTRVAPAEGDQPAALAGSFIGQAGMVSMSFGTSVCANSVGDRTFRGIHQAIDHFCAADGQPINMVFLRNGTTFMNRVIEMFGAASGMDRSHSLADVMPQLLAADTDCGGLLALPFLDDEPGLEREGGTALMFGFNNKNMTPGNVAKAALLATVLNLRLGTEVLDDQGFPRTEIILSGGLTKTPQLGQIIADVFRCQVSLLAGAEEGTAFGAALLAKFRHQQALGIDHDWSPFLAEHAPTGTMRFEPCIERACVYDTVYARHQALIRALTPLMESVGHANAK